MELLAFDAPLLMLIVSAAYIAIIIGIIYFIYRRMKKVLVLKQEQNDLLRELVKKMDNR
jgi:NADH:ubiquinone oxidoreductase subunit K